MMRRFPAPLLAKVVVVGLVVVDPREPVRIQLKAIYITLYRCQIQFIPVCRTRSTGKRTEIKIAICASYNLTKRSDSSSTRSARGRSCGYQLDSRTDDSWITVRVVADRHDTAALNGRGIGTCCVTRRIHKRRSRVRT